jgi:hydrogenase/urease accessory protein HupE
VSVRRGLAAAALAALPVLTLAHQAGLSYGAYALDGDRLDVTLRISAAELAASWPELVSGEGLRAAVADPVVRRVADEVVVEQGTAACALSGAAGSPEPPDGARITATYRCPRPGGPVDVRLGFVARLPPGHVHLAKVLRGRSDEEHVVDRRHEGFRVEARSGWWRGAAAFVVLGVEHILGGWDHLAFLLGLLLASRALRDVMRVLTMFTVGHAITLTCATLGVVSPPAKVVEPLIAASVVFVGAANLVERRPPRPGGRAWVAGAFGLVHGFGFAGALGALRLPRAGLVTALCSFNVGVELGQAAIVTLAFPLLALVRRRPRLAWASLPAGSIAVAGAGLFWLVQRLAQLTSSGTS